MNEVIQEGRCYKSAEHMYQHLKCTFLKNDNLAERVLEADTALDANKLTESLRDVSYWFKDNEEDAMRTVLKAKSERCQEIF